LEDASGVELAVGAIALVIAIGVSCIGAVFVFPLLVDLTSSSLIALVVLAARSTYGQATCDVVGPCLKRLPDLLLKACEVVVLSRYASRLVIKNRIEDFSADAALCQPRSNACSQVVDVQVRYLKILTEASHGL
jgi:hypothetical protein